MKNPPLSRRIAWCGFCMVALLVVLAGCGGGSSTATNASSPTAIVGTTSTPAAPSPATTTPGVTPTTSQPSPTPTRTTPTPTPSRPSPTPTPPKPTPTPTPPPPSMVVVTITTDSSGSFAFSPQTLNIKVGTTVTWKNNTVAPHTVTSDTGAFGSQTISPGGTYSFKFTQAGTFTYHCMIHPYMMASVIVK